MRRHMLRLAVGVVMLAAATVYAQDGLSARVEEGRIVLTSHGTEYQLFISKDALHMRISDWNNPIRFSVADVSERGMDWLGLRWTHAEVTGDTETEKTAKAVCTIYYRPGEVNPKTRRGQAMVKGEAPPEITAQVEVVLRVRADVPGISMEQTVVNRGAPFKCYCLPWFNAGNSFLIPGPEGVVEKKFQGKYATVAEGTLPWIFLPSRDAIGSGLGIVFPEPEKVFIGEYGTTKSPTGTIYLNAVPRKQALPTGGEMTMRLHLLPADTAEEVQAACDVVK